MEALSGVEQRLFTVKESHRLAETGILHPDERVELVCGVVRRRMSPKNRAHVVAATRLHQQLVSALAGRAAVLKEGRFKLIELDSELEPDIVATSSPEIDAYGTDSSKPLLVVEVAESSLRCDLSAKLALYAEARVPEYRFLNLVDRELVVFRSAHEGSYRDRATSRAGDRVAPDAWQDVGIELGELFPAEDRS